MRIIATFISLFIICLPAAELKAQARSESTGSHEYKNGVGIRAGRTSGLTFKHFFNTGNSMELILGFWANALGFTALYEKNMSAGMRGLIFYYGAGGHVTVGTDTPYYRRHDNREGPYVSRYGHNGLAAGVDGIAGLEYKIAPIPLAISLDLKPFVEVSNYGVIYPAIDGSLGVKLAF